MPMVCPVRRSFPTSRITSRACTRCPSGCSSIGPLDLRHVPSPIYLTVEGEHVPRQAVWMRTRRAIPDDPAIHRAALAYLSDLTIQESILRAHGVAWATPGLKVASLDHAMWWHRPGRVDDWMLYVQESPSARGGRGLATGRIYSRGRDAAGQRRAGDHGAGSDSAGRRALTLLSAGARRRSARRGTAPRRSAARRCRRTGRPVAVSTSTTTADARAYSSWPAAETGLKTS